MQSILKWCVNLVWCKMHIASAEALFSCCWIHCTLRKDLIGQFPICSCTMNVLIVWMFFAWSIWFWAQGMMQAADCFAKGVAFLTSHFTLHTAHCTLHTKHFTLHSHTIFYCILLLLGSTSLHSSSCQMLHIIPLHCMVFSLKGDAKVKDTRGHLLWQCLHLSQLGTILTHEFCPFYLFTKLFLIPLTVCLGLMSTCADKGVHDPGQSGLIR